MAKRMGAQLMAIVAEGERTRIYLPPDETHQRMAQQASSKCAPEEELPYEPRAIWCALYGLSTYRDLFTHRQLVALTTFSDLVSQAREQALRDAIATGLSDDGRRVDDGGTGAAAYADAVATYCAFGVSRLANRTSSICIWNTAGEKVDQTFGRQAIPMAWDFAEANPFSGSTGSWVGSLEWIPQVLELLPTRRAGTVRQVDATRAVDGPNSSLIVTDPPYYGVTSR